LPNIVSWMAKKRQGRGAIRKGKGWKCAKRKRWRDRYK